MIEKRGSLVMVDEKEYKINKILIDELVKIEIRKRTWKSTLIFGMLILYSILFMIDFGLTMHNPELEGNPVCILFIHYTGLPLNLMLPLLIANTYFLIYRFKAIDTNLRLFGFWYVYLLIFIIGHIAGIKSWM